MKSLVFSCFFCIAANFCSGQTSAEMDQEAYKAYQKADKELNLVYQKILKEYKSDTVFIANLKTAQKIWIQFRDAELNAMFPVREGLRDGVERMCRSYYLAELTGVRIKKLKVWLEGIEEGDVCTGSVKMKSTK